MRYIFFILLGILPISALAEETDLNRRFKNTPQELSNDKTLEFWGYQNYQANSSGNTPTP